MGEDCSCVGEIGLGPWGYEEGNEWSFKPKQSGGIKQIIIRYGLIIDSLVFKANTSDDDYSAKFGGDGGDRTLKIDVDFPSEFLTGISGTYGSAWFFPNNVCSLTFHTNKTQHGPFGATSGTAFSVKANGGVVTGFHGRYGKYLASIGLYVMPLSLLSLELQIEKQPTQINSARVPRFLLPSRSAAALGGDGGRDWDDGVFAAVKGVHVCVRVDTGVISAVRFTYLKSDGSAFLSPFHGGYVDGDVELKTVSFSKMIIFYEKDEYLIGVEGFCGAVEGGLRVITSLSFLTNKRKYGPVGAQIGQYFSSINSGDCQSKVVGFYGRSGACLDAIGLHTEYSE